MSKSLASLLSSGAAARVGSSAIRDLLHLTERPEIISLAGGLPSPAAFPVEEIARATSEVLRDDPAAALQYTSTEGLPELRAWVAAHRAVPTAPEQVLVTHGSQQALDLVVRATAAPGHSVALADPGYVGALQAFRLSGAELVGIPRDADGLRVDVLADRLAGGLRPRLVYVVADFDNPTGATLSAERRRALAALADRYGFLIVDDDPYGDLRWQGEPLVPLCSLSDRVVSLGTTSKILCPGLRVGWAIAAPTLAAELVTLKQAADLHTSSFAQQVVARVLHRPDFLEPHVTGLRRRYQAQSTALVTELREQLGDRVTVDPPLGGMFVWCRLHGGIDTGELLDAAIGAGMAFVPGRAFGVHRTHADGLRLSFATEPGPRLTEAVRRLASVLPT